MYHSPLLKLNLQKKMRNRRNKTNHNSLLQHLHKNRNSTKYLMRLRCDLGRKILQELKRRDRRRKLII
jgi:hypothetical protein